jgi:hypothetical protein
MSIDLTDPDHQPILDFSKQLVRYILLVGNQANSHSMRLYHQVQVISNKNKLLNNIFI